MHVILLIVGLGIIASSGAFTLSHRQSFCKVSIFSLGSPQPLYLYHQTSDLVETSNGTGHFYLDANEKIDIYCSNGFRPPYANGGKIKMLTATCISNSNFHINNRTDTLRDVKCTRVLETDTRITKRKCVSGNTAEIGFNVQGAFIPMMEVCHDNETASTTWVHHFLTKNSQNFQRNVPRVPFLKGKFYQGISPDNLYTVYVQRRTLAKILGSPKIANDIVQSDLDLYFARGHLAAKSDFVFAAHQLATFYYINAAPQWQTFNNGNWLAIENGVKKFLKKRKLDAELYTGTYGVMVYPDAHKNEQEIFLAFNEQTGQRQIPAPRFYYKVLIVDEIQAGIVFIGVNNPYLTLNTIKSKYILCPDVSAQVEYIAWQPKNITIGYSYACSINEFTKVVKDLPPHIPKYSKLLI